MISYTITVCNEDLELDILLRMLSGSIRVDDEIVLQMDSMTTTSAVRAVIDSYRIRIQNLKVV